MSDIDDMLDKAVAEHSNESKIEKLEKEVWELRKTLESYGIIEEVHITNIEYICQKGIEQFKDIVNNGMLTQDDARTLDLLHKNLRMARGKLEKKEAPGKAASEAELLKLVTKDE